MKLTRSDATAWRDVDGETIVIHLGRRRLYGLDELGGQLWHSLEQTTTFEHWVDRAVDSIDDDDVSRERIAAGVLAFVDDLQREGLVAIDGAVPAGRVPHHRFGPRILWREAIQQFAGQCHLVFGQSHQCNQNPGSS